MKRSLFLVVTLLLTACGRVLAPLDEEPLEPSSPSDSATTSGDDGGALAKSDAVATPDNAAPGTLVSSSIASFSAVQGQGGWFYGYTQGAGPFSLLEAEHPTRWSLPTNMAYAPWLDLTAEGGSPDLNGSSEFAAIRRWVSDQDGELRVVLRFFKTETSCGNGVVAEVALGGVTHWSKWIAYDDAVGVSEETRFAVRVGDPVDFRLRVHEGNGSCDHAHFSAEIWR